MKPDTSESQGVFESGDDAVHRALDRLGERLGKTIPRRATAFAALGSILAIVTSTLVAQSPVGSRSQASNPAPLRRSPASPSATQPLVGKGPFVLWTNTLDQSVRVGIYGLDLSAAKSDGSFEAVLIATARITGVTTIVGQHAPARALPVLANDNGEDRLFVVTRAGMKVLDPSLQFPQFPGTVVLSDDNRRLAVVVTSNKGAAVHIQNLDGSGSRNISIVIPKSLQGTADRPFLPNLVAWYDHQRRFLMSFTNGGESAPMYSLDLNGHLTALPLLDNLGVSASGMLRNQQSFVFGQGHDLAVVDIVHHSIRTVRGLHENFFSGALVSPDGSRVAYTSGPGIEVARVTDGVVLQRGFLDGAPNVTPLVWIDNQRMIAIAYSTDLVTGQGTQALLLFDARGATGEPPTVFFQTLAAGGQDMFFLGLLM
jgi:hypothetical protein